MSESSFRFETLKFLLKQNVFYIMSNPSRAQILRLYKYLIRYGNQLKLTDKDYFISRVKNEFKENKILTSEQEIQFYFKKGETLLRNGRIV